LHSSQEFSADNIAGFARARNAQVAGAKLIKPPLETRTEIASSLRSSQ
jgi:hypothetical protein